MTRSIRAGERTLAVLAAWGGWIRVTTSAAPNTVRVYHRDVLACKVTGIGTGVARPSWAAAYLEAWPEGLRKIVVYNVLLHLEGVDLAGGEFIIDLDDNDDDDGGYNDGGYDDLGGGL